jgi:DNA-binding transcriptional LysR family regulator
MELRHFRYFIAVAEEIEPGARSSPASFLAARIEPTDKRSGKLKDFRHDKFLAFDLEYGFGYEQWLRGFCKRLGEFDPEIAALANSPESLISMVAAGRGVFLGPEIAIRAREETWRSAGDIYLLTDPGSYFDLFAIWKKQAQGEQIISKFIDVLVAEIESPTVSPS